MANPSPSSSAAPADSPVLSQLKAREKMLQDKIARRIPAAADRKEESLARAKFHLQEVKEQISKFTPKS